MGRLAAIVALVLLVCVPSLLRADQRVDPMDVIVALDKSLSMEEEIGAVKEYLSTSLVDGLLIPGDLFVVIAFYGKTDILVSTIISDEASKAAVKAAIATVKADGRWTDIGGALDELKRQLAARGRAGIPKHLLLVTDGKPEPPPDSKYWSPDGSFTHEFLDNTRTIQKEGWKVQVLGIGSAAEARDLADKLSGVYTEVKDKPTVDELTESTRGFLGSMTIQGTPKLSRVGRAGRATISFAVKSSGYDGPKTVVLSSLELAVDGEVRDNLLASRQTFQIPATGLTEVSIPLLVSPPLEPGKHKGTLDFRYQSDERFMPTVLDVEINVNSALGNNSVFIIPGAGLVVIGIVLFALLVVRRTRRGRIEFRVVVAEAPLPKGTEHRVMRPGSELYLDLDGPALSLSESRNDRSVARLYVGPVLAESPRLAIELIEPKSFFHVDEIPASLVGGEIVLRTETGHKLHVSFLATESNA